MKVKHKIHIKFSGNEAFLNGIIARFDSEGEPYGNQDRNSLKLFYLNELTLNVKSFKIPNIVNKVAYRFFRKSKAQRSFEYANTLQELGVGTPQPVAYYEFVKPLALNKSYYISAHQDYDLTYRELTLDLNYPDHENILRAFTRFTYDLHEKGINFLDHSPGNTLIKKVGKTYQFYLVDLNRMRFETLSFEDRIKNFAKLTIHKSMIATMSDEYAKLIGRSYEDIFDLMWSETQRFQEKFHRRRRLKSKVKFWKK